MWYLSQPPVAARFARVRLSENICTNVITITSTWPTFDGNIYGYGTSLGVVLDKDNAVEVSNNGSTTHWRAWAHVKMCVPFKGSPFCTLTSDLRFDGYYTVATRVGPNGWTTWSSRPSHVQINDTP